MQFASRRFLALIVFLAISWQIKPVHCVLTSAEINALAQILEAFPDLRSVAVWRQYPDSSTAMDYGGSWTNDINLLCNGNDGYTFYGVHCTNGHVSALMITDTWGAPVSDNFDQVPGLTFLRNLTDDTTKGSGANLTSAVLNLSLEHIYLPNLIIHGVPNPGLVQSLSGRFDSNFNFGSFSSLRFLHLKESSGASSFDFTPLRNSLVSLKLEATLAISGIVEHFEEFVVLRRFECAFCDLDIFIPFNFSSPTLESLILRGGLQSATTITYSINCPSLTELIVEHISPILTSITAPNLRSLEAIGWHAFPTDFTGLTKLERLKIDMMVGPHSVFPDTSALSSLKHFELNRWNCTDNFLQKVLCDIQTTTGSFAGNGIESIALQFLQNTDPLPRSFPSCLLDARNLRSLSVISDDTTSNKYSITSFFNNIPRTITELTLKKVFDQSLTLSAFYPFANLETMIVEDPALVGEIDHGAWRTFGALSIVSLTSEGLNGTIPWYGWERLETLYLSGQFKSWPGLYGTARNLQHLSIESIVLDSMPSDEMFEMAELDALQTFIISAPQMRGPLPIFWENHPQISEVHLSYCAFEGMGPSVISATRLTILRLNNNNLCGSLPAISGNVQLSLLDLSNNFFSNSIPSSWASLTILNEVNLANNLVNGTIPEGLFTHHALLREYIRLAGNTQLMGSLWNMSQGVPYYLSIAHTQLNVCTVDPGIQPGDQINSCDYTDIGTCPNNCPIDFYASACQTLLCNQILPDNPPILPPCVPMTRILPPVSIPPSPAPAPPLSSPPISNGNSCPLPAPIGFACVNGAYLATGNVSVPTVTFPPGAGVVVVNGSFTSNGTVIFSGTGTTLDVRGCVEGLPTVELQLSGNEEPNKQLTLITQENGCSYDLKQTPVLTKDLKSGCKKSKVSTSPSTPSSLVVTLSFDSSGCNTKWIILGSVVGGVIVLAVIVVVLLTKFNPAFRDFIRPFRRRNQSKSV